jgi:hypothetical protein
MPSVEAWETAAPRKISRRPTTQMPMIASSAAMAQPAR